MTQAEKLIRNHFQSEPENRIREQIGRVQRFLDLLEIEDGDLADHLSEQNFRRYHRRSPKQPTSIRVDVSVLRSMAVSKEGERIELRRSSKLARKNPDTILADVQVAARRIAEQKDADAAAALVAVLCDVRFENFPEVVSTRLLCDRQPFLPIALREIADSLLSELPDADLGRVSITTWNRARIVTTEGRPQLRPMGIRILRNQLLADEAGVPVARLLSEGAILPITRRDELSPRTNKDVDWCRLLTLDPVADVLFEETRDLENSKSMSTQPPSRAEVRRRAAEIVERHKSPDPLPPSHQAWLDARQPSASDVVPHREQIREPVFQVVRRVQLVKNLSSFKRMTYVVEKIFAEAAAQNRSLDPAEVLNERNINRFANSMRGDDQTRATYRSDLRRAARYWPGTGLVEKPIRMPRGSITAPYSGEDIRTLQRVLTSQSSSDDRANRAKCYFGLGIGAGLKSKEINLLTADCFRTHEASGLLVTDVPATKTRPGRSVPLLSEWDDFVRPNLPDHGPLVTETGKNRVSASYQRLKSKSKFPAINQDRLRNTWLVHLMASPDVSLATILDLAGLVSARSLEDLVPYAPLDKSYDQVVEAIEGGRNNG